MKKKKKERGKNWIYKQAKSLSPLGRRIAESESNMTQPHPPFCTGSQNLF
jgi:hypothetical protein